MAGRVKDSKAHKKFEQAGIPLFTGKIQTKELPLYYAKTGSDNLPTLFFVHGSAGSWWKYEKFLRDPELLKKYRLVAVDRPGYGYSDYGHGQPLAIQSPVLHKFLQKIKNEKPLIAVGHSYGGSVVAKMAVDFPGIFDQIIFLAAALDPSVEKTENWRKLLFKAPFRWLIPRASRSSNVEFWWLKKELEEIAGQLNNISCPVVVLHGDRDKHVPLVNVDYIRKKFSAAKNISVRIIPGADHFLMKNRYQVVRDTLLGLNVHS